MRVYLAVSAAAVAAVVLFMVVLVVSPREGPDSGLALSILLAMASLVALALYANGLIGSLIAWLRLEDPRGKTYAIGYLIGAVVIVGAVVALVVGGMVI